MGCKDIGIRKPEFVTKAQFLKKKEERYVLGGNIACQYKLWYIDIILFRFRFTKCLRNVKRKKNIYYAKLFLIQIKFFKNKIITKEFFTNVTFVLGKKICDKE